MGDPTKVPLTGSLCRCSICRRTFRNLGAFDAHRPDRAGCGDPCEVGLVEQGGVWATSEGHASAESSRQRLETARAAQTARRSRSQSDEQAETLPGVPRG